MITGMMAEKKERKDTYKRSFRNTLFSCAAKSGECMRIVVALGGNALLKRDEPMTADTQRKNIRTATLALSPLVQDHELVLSHGNGPQVGLLALQAAAYTRVEPYPLDVLDAQTEGMIGYMIEQELRNLLPRRYPLCYPSYHD